MYIDDSSAEMKEQSINRLIKQNMYAHQCVET